MSQALNQEVIKRFMKQGLILAYDTPVEEEDACMSYEEEDRGS
jgi:hypothetical protein